ncbi:GDP-L-fucose synthase family protein [Rickettsiales endosymbiont of Stachyamoeba lipophora]|uniref:GDP-L-fucose synthase family protein n=1 Tax=Rickettsiales endosymbiont of Stachyamoeba lipophora TaxID=2486578 RepID=UPI000F64F4D7|nr:GDP-L-fucose synthase [Rickettsiales endosymbiont of Stachyamoeba lipophora]AZL15486.1 GDP-L-fucose synthase [Rickettsiales endosymbiont of Stachyamoeba lipophora]
MQKDSQILVTGFSGLIGSSLTHQLQQEGYKNLILVASGDADLTNQLEVERLFEQKRPEYVFHLAAKVGGIVANNTLTAEFIYNNTQMQSNVINAAYKYGVKKLLFPGSACTYPREIAQPMKEEALFTGKVEPTNIAYATAKQNGIIMCQAYHKQYGFNAIVPMPTNAYGLNDHYDPNNSHVIPALLQKLHQAKINNDSQVVIWGSGKPLREFIFADDVANAFIFLMHNYNSPEIINVGTQQEISILELARLIAGIVGFEGKIINDVSKPDGIPRKCLDSTNLFAMGWQPKTSLKVGIEKVYTKFKQNAAELV